MLIQKLKSVLKSTGKLKSEVRRYGLLLLLPLILGGALLLCVHQVTSAQISQHGTSTAMFFQANASSMIREMQLVSDSLLKDRRFMENVRVQNKNEVDPFELCDIIAEHVHESVFVNQALVISPQHGAVYSTNGYFRYDALDALLQSVVGQIYEEGKAVSGSIDLSQGWHILNANFAPPYYVIDIPYEDGATAATLLVSLNMREFLSTLYQVDADLCCIFNDEFALTSILNNHPDTDWRSEDAVSTLLDEKVRCFYIEDDGFTYLTAVSVHEYNAPLRTILYVFCAYFALVLVVGLLCLLLFSSQRYLSVSVLMDGLPHSPGNDSNYEEIWRAVRTTLHEYRDIFYEEQERAQRENLCHILSGSYAKSLSAQQLTEAGLVPDQSDYYVTLIHIRGGGHLVMEGRSPVKVDMTSLILRSTLERFAEQRAAVSVTPKGDSYCAVLSILDASTTNEDVRRIVTSSIDLIETEYGRKLRCAVSSPISDPNLLPTAWQQVSNLYSFSRTVDSTASVILQEDISSKIGVVLNGSYLQQMQILSRTLLMEKYDMIPSMVDVILNEHVAALGKHFSLAHSRLSAVANVLAEAILTADEADTAMQEAAAHLQQADSIQQVSNLSHEVFPHLSSHSQCSESEDIVGRACSYIRDHISDPDLGVPKISEAVSVSAQHLSRLFRQKLDTTILEYTTTCRIERAKQLLLDCNLTVTAVAEKTGYNNNVTFTRNFRRYVGLTPSEYRELNK